ncbi:MAG: peptidoglycan DD-metalloendopeptidase family protein [Thalassobaculum sp.]
MNPARESAALLRRRHVEPVPAAPYTAGTMIRSIVRPAAVLLACLALAACAMGGSGPRLANPDPASNPPSTAGSNALPADGVITVRPGDTVYALARRYGVSARTLIENNRLAPPYLLHVGDRLFVPVPRVHVVRSGDTLSEVARDYRVDFRRLASLNGLRPPYEIRVGQRLRLPGASDGSDGTVVASRAPRVPPVQAETVPPPRDPNQPWSSGGSLNFPVRGSEPPEGPTTADAPPLPAPRPGESGAGDVVVAEAPPPTPRAPTGHVGPARESAARTAVLTPPPRAAGRFLWPVDGRVIAGFGPREGGLHNDGINIAADQGTQVRAAENGVVVYAGNELRGFGNLLLIKHADGWTTAYAHADKLLVRRGDRVKRGQPIATVGQTGNVDRPQLHFEIRRGPRAVDPRDELGAARASTAPGRPRSASG